jgi:hypothetical protein
MARRYLGLQLWIVSVLYAIKAGRIDTLVHLRWKIWMHTFALVRALLVVLVVHVESGKIEHTRLEERPVRSTRGSGTLRVLALLERPMSAP